MIRAADSALVLSALALHGAAHGRGWIVAPLALIVVATALRGRTITHRSGLVVALGAAGAALGFAVALASPPPAGPIPPLLLSPICTALCVMSTFCVVSRKRSFAWVYAWLLCVLSSAVELSPLVSVALGAVALSTFAVLATLAREPAFIAFAAATLACAMPLAGWIHATEGALVEALAKLQTSTYERRGQMVDLPAAGEATLTDEAILELDGDVTSPLRTGVLDRFYGTRWGADAATLSAKLAFAGGEGASLLVTFLADSADTIPLPAGALAVDDARAVMRGGWVVTSDHLGGRTVRATLGPERLPEEEAPPLLELSDKLRAELAPLAREITGDETDPEQQARAIAQFFQRGFHYSLSVDLRGDGHPLAVLVRERRAAYCTYFASAMAALLTVRGVPARLVTGYLPRETNAWTGRTTIRQRDAHAWVEVYVPRERRFVAFDPTPLALRDEALKVTRSSGLFAAWRSLMARAFASLRFRPGDTLLSVMRAPLTWVIVLSLAAWVFRRRVVPSGVRRKRAPLEEAADPALRAAYRTYLAWLSRRGVTRGTAETDADVLARLSTEDRAAAEAFVTAFHRARFGGGSANVEEVVARLR